jgi:hypothetical protein
MSDLPTLIVTPRDRRPLSHAGLCVVCRTFTNEAFIFESRGEVIDVPACLSHSREDVLDAMYWNLAMNLRRPSHG